MTTLRISITKDVLEATKDCLNSEELTTNCAIAFAVRKIWPTAEIHQTFFYPIYPKLIIIGHHQSEFIERFDDATPDERAAMQPFSFEIEVPDEVINEINIEEIRDIIKNSKTLELVN